MCLKELRDEFLYDCECRHLAKGSIRNYRAETKFLMEFLELKQITEVEDVKAHHIRDFMKQKQDSGNTACYVNDILKACKTWFNYLVEEDYIEERRNPAAKVKYLKQPKTIIETFSTQEVKELIHYYSGCDYLEVRNKTIITLLFDTGMRCNEMIMMEPEDIKKDYIVVKHGKGNKERVVPKSPMLSKQLVKDILFTTKAMGVGIGLKDRGVKHIFIDQWNPLEIAQSLGRKRSLDADDTCTVYFRDYSLDWYWGTNSGLKKFRSMLLNKYLPAQAYMAGEEEFDKYLHSDNPEVIQKKIDKSKILEHNVVTGYHINPLGLQQVEHDIEMLDDLMSSTNYPESFMKYAMFNLYQPIKAYRFKNLEDWLYAHLNQPMDPEEMTEKIMSFGYIERYQGREPGQMGLNKFLPCYGVKIVSDRENKRNENRNKTFWTLIKQ